LRQLGQERCSGDPDILIEDRYGYALWGCARHAAETLRLIPGTTVRHYRRKSDEDVLRRWLDGEQP
jgi:hypothetical protein